MHCLCYPRINFRQVITSLFGLAFFYQLNNFFEKAPLGQVLKQKKNPLASRFIDSTSSSVPCPHISPKLVGWTNLSLEAQEAILLEDEDLVELKMKKFGLKSGGHYEPSECQSKEKVAIIVPLRDRKNHLTVFLRYMHPFLQRQQLNYVIIVVVQSALSPFNRGMLMNIGFKEAQKLQKKYECFIFHDVDLLPENDGNPYTCPEDGKPRQMSYSIDHSDYSNISYKPTPWSHFGGVTALSLNDFKKINGYSNSFWGWGGEDDLLFDRVLSENLTVTRAFDGKPTYVVHYKSLFHKKAAKNPQRMELIEEGPARFKTDGLSNLNYEILELQFRPLYTYILVNIQPLF